MSALGFGGFECPNAALGIGEKLTELGAAAAAARKHAGSPPVLRCLQRLRDADAQVVEADGAQTSHGGRAIADNHQFANGRDHDGVEVISLRPAENDVCRPLGQSLVDLPESGQQVDDKACFHTRPPSPGIDHL